MPPRQLRIPVTTGISNPGFQISPADWPRLEKGYASKIGYDERKLFEFATARYRWLAEMERKAQPWVGVGKKISAIRRTAQELLGLLEGPSDLIIENAAMGRKETGLPNLFPSQRGGNSDVDATVGHLIRQQLVLPSLRPFGGDHFAAAVRNIESMSLALSKCDLSQIKGHQKQGQAWDHWVCELTAIAEHAELPFGVSKDPRSASDSPFVCLVAALQDLLPEEYQRCQEKSPDGSFTNKQKLADAIHTARERKRARTEASATDN
jgi:hypothetical protein